MMQLQRRNAWSTLAFIKGTCKQVSSWHHLPRSLSNGFSCIFNDPDCTSRSTSPKHSRNHVIMSLHNNFVSKIFFICNSRLCFSWLVVLVVWNTTRDANVEHRLSSYLNKAVIYSHERNMKRSCLVRLQRSRGASWSDKCLSWCWAGCGMDGMKFSVDWRQMMPERSGAAKVLRWIMQMMKFSLLVGIH